MSENNHKVGFKVAKHPSRVEIYIDRNRINAESFYLLNKDGKRLSEDEIMDLEVDNAELEVRDIEGIAIVMNKETFDKFCETWRNFHE